MAYIIGSYETFRYDRLGGWRYEIFWRWNFIWKLNGLLVGVWLSWEDETMLGYSVRAYFGSYKWYNDCNINGVIDGEIKVLVIWVI